MNRALTVSALAPALPVFGQQEQLPPGLPPEELLRQFVRNGDGKISRDEAPPRSLQRWDQVDTDHDGFITPEELEARDVHHAPLPQTGQGLVLGYTGPPMPVNAFLLLDDKIHDLLPCPFWHVRVGATM